MAKRFTKEQIRLAIARTPEQHAQRMSELHAERDHQLDRAQAFRSSTAKINKLTQQMKESRMRDAGRGRISADRARDIGAGQQKAEHGELTRKVMNAVQQLRQKHDDVASQHQAHVEHQGKVDQAHHDAETFKGNAAHWRQQAAEARAKGDHATAGEHEKRAQQQEQFHAGALAKAQKLKEAGAKMTQGGAAQQTGQLARYHQAKTPGAAQSGPRGGRYYTTSGGGKRYTRG